MRGRSPDTIASDELAYEIYNFYMVLRLVDQHPAMLDVHMLG